MNRNDDFEKFNKLMVKINELTPGKDITPTGVDGYFECCEDLNFEVVEKNCMKYVQMVGFFPKVPDMRGETQEDLELQARADLDLVTHLVENFLFEGFGSVGLNVVKIKLEEKNRLDLLPFASRWGHELAYSDNPTATRAQALKALKTDIQVKKTREVLPKQSKKINSHINKLTKSFEVKNE